MWSGKRGLELATPKLFGKVVLYTELLPGILPTALSIQAILRSLFIK